MAKAATSKKAAPVDTLYLFQRGRQFHYRRRVPDWLQPIVGVTFWWQRLGSDEATARHEAAALSRRYDRLCAPEMRRLVMRSAEKEIVRPPPIRSRTVQGDFDPRSDGKRGSRAAIVEATASNPIHEILDEIALAPLDVPPLPDDLLALPDGQMRVTIALHRALTGFARSEKADRERVAPLVEALTTAPAPGALTVSEVADQWLSDIKPASGRRYRMVLRRFKETIGDPPLTAVTVPMMWQFRDQIKEMPALGALPPHLRHAPPSDQEDWLKEHPGAGLPAAVRNASAPAQMAWRKQHPDHPAILPGAVENHMSVLRALFTWCMDRELVTANPAKRLDAGEDPRGKDNHNHPALPYSDIPEFMADLASRDHLSAKALRFVILTATRTQEVMAAEWSEIDLRKRTWTIPALRMKSRKEHVIPLSAPAVALLEALPRDSARVFVRMGKEALLDYLTRQMGRKGVTVHGFRATFRTWAAEETTHDASAVEFSLAHSVGSKLEQAYQRGTMFEKRRALMDSWAVFCDGASA
jgi:integrase